MELNHLRYFYEVGRAGSFTAAARRLRVSQSALSKAVALLEDAQRVKLFTRSKTGVALTPVGGDVFRGCEQIFRTVTEIENTCLGRKETCDGPLTFGASDHVTNYVLMGKIRQLCREHPSVMPRIVSGSPHELVSLILEGELEFGLFFTQVAEPQIVYESLFSAEMSVVCAPACLPEGASAKKPRWTNEAKRRLFERAGFIGSIKSMYRKHPSEELLGLLGRDIPAAFESNSQEAQKRFCLDGGGLAFLAKFMVEEELRDGRLIEVPLERRIEMKLHLARRRGRELSLNARTFLALLEPARGS